MRIPGSRNYQSFHLVLYSGHVCCTGGEDVAAVLIKLSHGWTLGRVPLKQLQNRVAEGSQPLTIFWRHAFPRQWLLAHQLGNDLQGDTSGSYLVMATAASNCFAFCRQEKRHVGLHLCRTRGIITSTRKMTGVIIAWLIAEQGYIPLHVLA